MDQQVQHDLASTIAENAGSGGFAPGQRISPRYAIIGELGRGSTGRVLNALDGLFDREVALKQNTVAGDAAAARLVREARITARIEHSNVAPVFDLERHPDGSVYFTMRRIVGIALGEVLRRRARGEPDDLPGGQGDIVTIFRKACDAVGRAHEQSLVHRDLKPDNIMLGRHGEVFVVDWGEAVDLLDMGPRSDGVSGTPAYMSPEQARGEASDRRSDVYALGASLFHALFGRFPLRHRTDEGLAELIGRRARGELDPPNAAESSVVPLPLQAIVLRAMAADPAERHADAEELGRALADFQAGRMDAWEQLADLRFDRGDQIDPRFAPLWCEERERELFPCPERIEAHPDRLVVGGHPHRTFLRWSAGISEEARLEVEMAVPAEGGINLDLCVCGDTLTGFRLRSYGDDFLTLETIRNGVYDVLGRWHGPYPAGSRRRYAIGHADNRVWIELDGRVIIDCCEPLPPRGAAHRTVSIGRYTAGRDCTILALRLWSRRPPLVVGAIEVGKQLLRSGHADDALAWFRRCMHQDQPPAVLHEAAYLAAMASSGETRLESLRTVAADADNPFHVQAWHLLAQSLAEHGDAMAAADALLAAERIAPDPGMCGRIGTLLVGRLHRSPPTELPRLLAALARLPLEAMAISNTRISDLAPLAGRRLIALEASGNGIADLSALSGMPLHRLDLSWNRIHDLAPLQHLPLYTLRIDSNPCTMLPPLHGAHLADINLAATGITDLAALAGQPIERLDIHDTAIRDLSPLAGAPLRGLIASRCPLADLTPVAGAPMASARLDGTAVEDAAPLANPRLIHLDLTDCPIAQLRGLGGTPLANLQIAGTRITDLSPLAGLPLRSLSMERTPVVDLSPLLGLPLAELTLSPPADPIDWSPLAGLPLHTLRVHGPLPGASLPVLGHLELRRLYTDLTQDAAWDLIHSLSSLRVVNGLDADFVRRLGSDLRHAFAGSSADLLRHAVEAGGSRLLPLPHAMTRAEAVVLAQRAGARLFCVPDIRRLHEVHRALLPLASEHLPTGWFHCGLARSASGSVLWADGSGCSADQQRMDLELASTQRAAALCLHQRLITVTAETRLLPVLEWVG